ncbi:hypothetical protein HOE37_01555 [Candidatus Woesearchaeota archaeon]|jgi:hypothetical protein|nr:hypothetical protein [Candidatus Woesearchaeota archaeon]MBT4110521.1 hypothetical protein [Candidatus Woesearchaeota archaeon]MBT4335955.1 hypothetical protein [Candidatus Woesearchaeota archaeon]MBT4469066.1 hypothetical protein [Candidatus Woesearchaeota archaeon]MBT6744615.1 hypothetical protein [Candidatus Woesearchaeota archaeon]
MDEKKRIVITIIISILALTILIVMVNKNLVGMGSWIDAGLENKKICNEWCNQESHCSHCSTIYNCGEDYTGMKHWNGYGENWHACEKRGTINHYWNHRPKPTNEQNILVVALGGASTSYGGGKSIFKWFCEDFFYKNGNPNLPTYDNIYCISSYAGVHTNSGILSDNIAELAEEMKEKSGKPTKIFLIGKSMGGCKLQHAVSGTKAAKSNKLKNKDIEYFVGVDMSCLKSEGFAGGISEGLEFKDNVKNLLVFHQTMQDDHTGVVGYFKGDSEVPMDIHVDVNKETWDVAQSEKIETVPTCNGVNHKGLDDCDKLKETIQKMVLKVACKDCECMLNQEDCGSAYLDKKTNQVCNWDETTKSCEDKVSFTQGELCDDSKDNDDDKLIDCADEDCEGNGDCGTKEHWYECYDKEDNDDDGLIDCQDLDCYEGNKVGPLGGKCCNPSEKEACRFEDGLICSSKDWECSPLSSEKSVKSRR